MGNSEALVMNKRLHRISGYGWLFIGLWYRSVGQINSSHDSIIGQLYKREKPSQSPTIGQLILLPCTDWNIKMKKSIQTNKLARSIEAILEISVRILGLVIVYLIFEYIGTKIIGNTFTPDLLLSLVVLPSIYILKDAHKIVEPFTVEVHTTDSDITVRMGFITQRVDRLLIKNIDNIEVTRTPIGRLLGYRTLHLYSAGGYVALPFLNDCSANTIENEIDLVVK